MKQIKITRTYEGWEDECKRCGQIIKGTSKSQVKINMQFHQMGKNCKKNKKK